MLLIIFLGLHNLFVKENIFKKGNAFNSEAASTRAQVLSNSKALIYSCGNCPSFYIKENLVCTGSEISTDLLVSLNEFILITYHGSRERCKSELFRNKFISKLKTEYDDIHVEHYIKRDLIKYSH